ncbi:TonB-dependent receptor [Neokomagataea thailandica NBRC 106555]|nr:MULTISPECIES: TonB-dependent receptor [Neokomagataea]GBR54044.1 TonB-dependent receptor [Neokomagataea thailandica NBRC 106555]
MPLPKKANAAHAPAKSHNGGLEDIVVTAQKRPENLQKTPISISVMNAKGLADRHIISLVNLADGSIPSLHIEPFAGRSSALIVNIRGVGVLGDSNQPARDQGVGVYIDGVYFGRPQGLGAAMLDVASIEVLKGPQGTLFGRNTEGGALNIITRRPSGKFKVRTSGSIGNYGSNLGELHVDLPAFHDIAVKIDAMTAHRDPLTENPLSGASGFNQYDRRGVRVEALWRPTSTFSADYAYDNNYDSTTSIYSQHLANGTNKQAALGILETSRVKRSAVGTPEQPSVGKSNGHRFTAEWQALPKYLTLKSITAYRELSQSQYDNAAVSSSMSNTSGDFTNYTFSRYSLAAFKQHQISQEIQAIGDLPHLRYVGGFLYYHETVSDNAQAFYTNQFTNAAGSAYQLLTGPAYTNYALQRIDRASRVNTASLGVYGQATYTPSILSERFHLTGGLRWSRDSKDGHLLTVNGALPVNRNNVSGAIPLEASWSRVDPMVNLGFDAAKNIYTYVKWSTGYKSGGANSRSQNYDAFAPETISMFEGGFKSEFFNHHVRFNATGYYGIYKDIQVDFQRPYQLGNQRTNRTTISTFNAPGDGNVSGTEAELTFIPYKGVEIGLSYAYNHVHIPPTANPYPNANGTILSTLVPIYQVVTPAHSGSAQINYTRPFEKFTLLAHLDGNINSGFYSSSTDPVYIGPNNPRNVYQPKGNSGLIVNGRIAIAHVKVANSSASATFSVWTRNLFNKQYVYDQTLNVTTGIQGYINEARQFGGQVDVSF